MFRHSLLLLAGLAAGLSALPAMAHPGVPHVHDLASGLLHPLTGWDHLLAFVAIGMWSAQQSRSAAWTLPLLFLGCMAGSAMLPSLGMHLPGLEPGVAASVALLGLMIANGFRFASGLSAAIVAVFAVLHGYTHGVEVPADAMGAWFGAGFIAATMLLVAGGLLLGKLAEWRAAGRLVRVTGSMIAMSGVVLLSSAM
ncbi:HupE/UreJ family protein [Noviherbaspirillum galbum]|uniref:HupE/UreJ family protein n=1 Tax=Noviherbaspirillum galbum TaxID=2709383 RepID=A0A6B3SSK1_9BURK|nr:HupE/UreJ family protein [Noviherbaspirillum galbum]NEX61806.1 HupE/UreJ family protein [Noviherbaspirillum galbum]